MSAAGCVPQYDGGGGCGGGMMASAGAAASVAYVGPTSC
jgi:hypothetical protein